MNEPDGIEPFHKSIRDQWKLFMTGGVFAAFLAALSILSTLGVAVSVEVPLWVAGLVFAITIIVAIYRAGMGEHLERLKLADRLKPKLEIPGIGEISNGHYRIRVRNLTGSKVLFRAKLLESTPKLINYPLPVNLQPTHGLKDDDEGEVAPYKEQSVDIFVDDGVHPTIGLKLRGNPPCLYPVPRNERRELLICVYPVSEEGGAALRWFYIVPQPNGSVILTADGTVKPMSPV